MDCSNKGTSDKVSAGSHKKLLDRIMPSIRESYFSPARTQMLMKLFKENNVSQNNSPKSSLAQKPVSLASLVGVLENSPESSISENSFKLRQKYLKTMDSPLATRARAEFQRKGDDCEDDFKFTAKKSLSF